MDTAKSAALGLLIATGLVDWKHKQNKIGHGKEEAQEATT